MCVRASPLVYWAQSKNNVYLRIDINNVENPDFKLAEDKVTFTANGIGAHGLCKYEFSLNLYSPIKNDMSNGEKPAIVNVTDAQINVVLQKKTPAWWPRCTPELQKPAWLKTNFDLWSDYEDTDEEKEVLDLKKESPPINDMLQQNNIIRMDLTKTYLVLYNLCQLASYLYCLGMMAIRFSKFGFASTTSTHMHVGRIVTGLQLLQTLDILHPVAGLTQGGPIMPFFQILGRLVIVSLLGTDSRLRTDSTVFFLFIAWSLVECVRCSYYITQLYNEEVAILKWLRYSMWMVLYPIGITCELTIMLKKVPILKESQFLTVALPNSWNFTFDCALFLQIYTFSTMCAGVILMTHMYKLRKQRLSPNRHIKKVT